ncbi:MAG TPA: MqnA/MqnD/SBP family protein [Thermodesulfobacteriota bacterium]|nr:MqnA/MqnD/SBP family protein [Thermodesulfobacteriota bacterium]
MKKLSIAYTPDSDDVFNFYAWEQGRVKLGHEGYEPVFSRGHIIELNHAALKAEYDVLAVSSVFYPRVADRYWVLCVGNSVGRDFGPMLVSKLYKSPAELRGKRVGVGGHPTTGSVLALMYCPEIELVEMPFDSIVDAIVSGDMDAGVMIHEELIHYRERGLECVSDLGAAWCSDTGLPLPVGLNLVRKDLGMDLARDIAATCQSSLLWGYRHTGEVYEYASRFGRGMAKEHIEMFRIEDFLRIPEDVREGMNIMFGRVAAMGLGPVTGSFEVIEGLDAPERLLADKG